MPENTVRGDQEVQGENTVHGVTRAEGGLITDETGRIVVEFNGGGPHEVPLPWADKVLVHLTRVEAETDGDPLNMRFSEDGGDTWVDDDDYTWGVYERSWDGDTINNNANNVTEIQLCEMSDARRNSFTPITLEFGNLETGRTTPYWSGKVGSLTIIEGTGRYGSNLTPDMVQFFGEGDGIDTLKGYVEVIPGQEVDL